MADEPGGQEPGLRHQFLEASGFLGFSISRSAEKRDSESLTYGVAASLVIRVCMSEGVCTKIPARQESQESPASQASTGINQGIPRDVHVQDVRLDQRDPPDALSDRVRSHGLLRIHSRC
jgi:hypothetical protein